MWEVLLIPSSDDEEDFMENGDDTFYEDVVEYCKKNKTEHAIHKFDSELEMLAFIKGYEAGIGYLGTGLYYTNE